MPSDVLKWLPQARLRLPFALHPPCFDQGLCLGFPAEQALDRQALGDVAVWETLFFSSSPVSHFGLGFGGGWERMACVTGSPCLLSYHRAPQREGVQVQALRPGWYPHWCLLSTRALWVRLRVGQVLGLSPLGGPIPFLAPIMSRVLYSQIPAFACWPVFRSLCGPGLGDNQEDLSLFPLLLTLHLIRGIVPVLTETLSEKGGLVRPVGTLWSDGGDPVSRRIQVIPSRQSN